MHCRVILFRCLRDRGIENSCCRMLLLCSILQWGLLSCICCIKSCIGQLSSFRITGCRLDKSCGALASVCANKSKIIDEGAGVGRGQELVSSLSGTEFPSGNPVVESA